MATRDLVEIDAHAPTCIVRYFAAAVAWLYDFLAEDVVLVVGMVLAIAVTALVVRMTSRGAGFALWAVVLVAVTVSLARTASAPKQ